jgi:hypothetical protein
MVAHGIWQFLKEHVPTLETVVLTERHVLDEGKKGAGLPSSHRFDF